VIALSHLLGHVRGAGGKDTAQVERPLSAGRFLEGGRAEKHSEPGLYTVSILVPLEFVQFDPDTGLIVIQRQFVAHSTGDAMRKAGVEARESR